MGGVWKAIGIFGRVTSDSGVLGCCVDDLTCEADSDIYHSCLKCLMRMYTIRLSFEDWASFVGLLDCAVRSWVDQA